MRALAAALAVLALATRPRVARACSVCGAGDPTLTVMGDEKPFGGRLRVDLEARLGRVRVGQPGVDEMDLDEQRFEVAAAYAPTRSIFVVLAIPALERQAVLPAAPSPRPSSGDER